MILKDKGRRDHTLTSAILGPSSGVHLRQELGGASAVDGHRTFITLHTRALRGPIPKGRYMTIAKFPALSHVGRAQAYSPRAVRIKNIGTRAKIVEAF